MKLKTIILLISSLSFSLSFADGVRVDLHGMGDLKLDFTPDGTYDSRNATKTILDKDTNGCISTYLPYGVASNCAGSDWVGGIMSGDVYSKQDKDGNNVNVKLMIKKREASNNVTKAIYTIAENIGSELLVSGMLHYYNNQHDNWKKLGKEDLENHYLDAYTFGKLTIKDFSDDTGREYQCSVILATYYGSFLTERGHYWAIFFPHQNLCGGLAISLNKSKSSDAVLQISKKK